MAYPPPERRNLSMQEYLRRRNRRHEPLYRFQGRTKADFQQWHKALGAEIRRALGPLPEPAPLNPEIIWEQRTDGLIKRRVLLSMEADMAAVAWVYIPEAALQKPAPAILCNHGHGVYGKDSPMGIRPTDNQERPGEIARHNYDYGLQMAQRGYVTIAIDWRGFGERGDGPDPWPGRDKCNLYALFCAMMGFNLLALDVFDAGRCLDYLQSLDCVDGERIGAMGLSFGGTMTTWISLLDSRIKAADIICYSDRFGSFGIDRGNICGSQTFFELYQLCDVPDLHGLIAPRPLLVEIGTYDECFLVQDALNCAREVEKIYAAAEASENFEIDLFEGGHQFAGNKAFDFFDRHLK